MSKPNNLNTKIFLDSGDPDKTREIKELLGFLDGQTTNPSLVADNPEVRERLDAGDKFTKGEIYDFYKEIVKEISGIIPDGDISIEVYADRSTKSREMYEQAKTMFSWIENSHIKLPATKEGLTVAEKFVNEGGKVNITLCFKQEQAAAVHAATRGAEKHDVYISPFMGRLDDRHFSGMDLVRNISRMYRENDSHVEVLAASVRHMDHFMEVLRLETDIVTAPYEVLKEWGQKNCPIPDQSHKYDESGLDPIPYDEFDLSRDWKTFHLRHPMTDKGMKKFSSDWNKLLTG